MALDFFSPERWFYWTVLAKGIRDGRQGLPAEDHFRYCSPPTLGTPAPQTEQHPQIEVAADRLSFYEAQLIELADIEIDKLCEKWKRTKDRIDGQCKLTRYELAKLLESLSSLHDEHKKKDLREPHRGIAPAAYIAFLVFIGLAEMGFNIVAFKILRLDWKELYVVAAGPSVIIPFVAHVIGGRIRQWKKEEGMASRTGVVLAIGVVCLIVALVSIGVLRADYLAYIGKSSINWQEAFALMGLNLLFLGGGIIAAYVAHDTDPDVERITDHKAKLLKRICKKWQTWNKLSGEFDVARSTTIERINVVRDDTRAKLDEYRRGVASAIAGGKIPSWFKNSISDRFFRVKEFGDEMDPAPASLEALLALYGLQPLVAAPAIGGPGANDGRLPELDAPGVSET